MSARQLFMNVHEILGNVHEIFKKSPDFMNEK